MTKESMVDLSYSLCSAVHGFHTQQMVSIAQ